MFQRKRSTVRRPMRLSLTGRYSQRISPNRRRKMLCDLNSTIREQLYCMCQTRIGIHTLAHRDTQPAILTRGKYTDKMIFDLKADGNNCIIEACSESQVTSVGDGGGNYCELKLLFCSGAEGCKVAGTDFSTSGETTEKRAQASIGLSQCLVSEEAAV